MSDTTTTSVLKYNLSWMENTFTSRAITENLLSPERESGNISSSDYDAAVAFLPRNRRSYRIIGGFSGLLLANIARRPSWTMRRFAITSTGFTLFGYLFGQAVANTQHYSFVRSIQDPIGFGRAMENIQTQIGGHIPKGPYLIRQVEDDNPERVHPPGFEPQRPKPAESMVQTPPVVKPESKWDQIRTANSRSAGNSSWDALRQSHEKTQLAKAGERSGPEQVDEQAQFDAMLEKERNMK